MRVGDRGHRPEAARLHGVKQRLSLVLLMLCACGGAEEGLVVTSTHMTTTSVAATSTTTTSPPTTTTTTTSQPTTTTTTLPPPPPSDQWALSPAFVVRSPDLQPKSIVATGTGLLLAQNMMYRHNVMVFDGDGTEVARIDDQVDLRAFGVGEGVVRGAPVEAAVAPDGSHAYVSNYKMYGPGWNPAADDDCGRGNWDDSFVYRIDLKAMRIDDVIPVGAVPKFLAVTPDGGRLVVANWCSFDVSVIDLATGVERRVNVGRHPRGIAITTDSRLAYVAVMGAARIDRIDLETGEVVGFDQAGPSPRHVVLSLDGRELYVTNNKSGEVRALDAATGDLLRVVRVGEEPRTMALSVDGTSLYVVLYRENALVKLRARDLTLLDRQPTGVRPVGVTVDPLTNRVWVADYAGSLSVFDDVPQPAGVEPVPPGR